jgi:hypothetical protein
MKHRHFYAVRWPCGVATHANTGHPIRTVARFSSAADRDAWVSEGAPYRTASGYRETVSAAEVRPDIRRAARQAPQGEPVWDYQGCGDNHGAEFLL